MVSHFDSCPRVSGVAYSSSRPGVRPRPADRARASSGPERHQRAQRRPTGRFRLLCCFEDASAPKRLRARFAADAWRPRVRFAPPSYRFGSAPPPAGEVAPRTSVGDRSQAPSCRPVTPPFGAQRWRVRLLLGLRAARCSTPGGSTPVHNRRFAAEGFRGARPPGHRTACGALELHSGREERRSRTTPASTVAAFPPRLWAPLDHVVRPAPRPVGGYEGTPSLLETPAAHAVSASAGPRRLGDAGGVRAAAPPQWSGSAAPSPTTTLATSNTRSACRFRARALLKRHPGHSSLLEVASESELCCGSAGIYNLVQPSGRRSRERKAKHLIEHGAEAIRGGPTRPVPAPARPTPSRARPSASDPPPDRALPWHRSPPDAAPRNGR